jgi:hypothetical protein
MADKHSAQPASGGWVSTFIFSIGLFLAVYLTTLYVGHTLAGGH